MRIANSNIPVLRRPTRSAIAVLLTLCYLLISLSPLMSLATYPKTSAPAVNHECSGDCASCGCPQASRVNRTCCCARKMQHQLTRVHEAGHDGTADCCRKKPDAGNVFIASCGCPWESGEQAALPSSESDELLPFHFKNQISIPCLDTIYPNQAHRLLSLDSDPPDPPPKLPHSS